MSRRRCARKYVVASAGVTLLSTAFLALVPATAVEPPVHECDRLAAHPEDPERMAEGVVFELIDTERAIAACEAAVAAFPNEPRYRFQLGRALHSAGRPEAALPHYRVAAEAGYAPAQSNLGTMYEYGEGIEKDLERAVGWHRRAAEQGYAPAQYDLGAIYFFGQGVERDRERAIRWLQPAAEQGFAAAQWNLGVAYSRGLGVSRDATKGVSWFKKAADQGHADAQYRLGRLHIEGHVVALDPATAFRLFRQAADQGHLDAMGNLGSALDVALGLPPEELALYGFDSAEEAVGWLKGHADAGYAWAQIPLGSAYRYGYGVRQDIDEAAAWYRRAAASGDESARFTARLMLTALMPMLFERGFEAYRQADYETALGELRPLAEEGYTDAQHYLGMMYVDGAGVLQDDLLAYMWLSLAAAQGETASKVALERLSATMTPAEFEGARRRIETFAPRNQPE